MGKNLEYSLHLAIGYIIETVSHMCKIIIIIKCYKWWIQIVHCLNDITKFGVCLKRIKLWLKASGKNVKPPFKTKVYV